MKAEFHIGDRVVAVRNGPLNGKVFVVDTISPSPKEDGTFIYSGKETLCFFAESELDYAPEPTTTEAARRAGHMQRLEQIHHDVGVLLEEGRCIAETYWADPLAAEHRSLMEDVDLLHRVHKTSSSLAP